MMFLRSFGLAFRALATNKSRSFLTMLGVIIGVAAVMMMLSVGTGAQVAVTGQIQSLGSNILLVIPGQMTQGGVSMANIQSKLTLEDAQSIAQIGGVKSVVPTSGRISQVVAGDKNANTNVLGATPAYSAALNSPVAAGSFFSQAEVDRWERVAVLGSFVAEKLFPGMNPIGESIEVITQDPRTQATTRGVFRIIGVLASKGATGFFNWDDRIVIPITTGQRLLFGNKNLGSISVEAENVDDMPDIAAEVNALLRLRHNVPEGKESDFTIFSQEDILGTLNTVLGYFTILLAGIAGISLLVGGIGIMNIMLVSVTERTREIGLRKAIGAMKRDIVLQFLIEAIVLSTTGGIVGIIFGYIGSVVISNLAGWPPVISLSAVGLGFIFSVAVGVFFGYYPAQRAASLNPIQALRYE
jgi:putative ABC transport system permease protein